MYINKKYFYNIIINIILYYDYLCELYVINYILLLYYIIKTYKIQKRKYFKNKIL